MSESMIPASLAELLASVLSRGLAPAARAGLQPFAGEIWELTVAGTPFLFTIAPDGAVLAVLPTSTDPVAVAVPTASIRLGVKDLLWLAVDGTMPQVQLSGRADFLQALGEALQQHQFSLARLLAPSTDLAFPAVGRALAAQFLERLVPVLPALGRSLLAQLFIYWRDEGGKLVHSARGSAHSTALLQLSDRITRLEARLQHRLAP